ncbi:MAG: ATP-binding protein [Candidatus Korarchaeota archaeon]|nr:ATP-binding protein [Thermoproteota archaeon]MCR8500989.1 ATP-binding protein [Thermoproteota archaeon]
MTLENIARDKVGDVFGKAGVEEFTVHVLENKTVQKGQFLVVIGDNRILLARVVDLQTSMKETLAECEILGEVEDSQLVQNTKPVRAGFEVYNPTGEFLSKVVTRTSKDEGLFVGSILTHPDFVPVYYNPKDLRVHVLVSATTGGGKSYTLSVFIEELIKKTMIDQKTPTSILIFDVHDEYSGLIVPNLNKKQIEALREFNLEPTGFLDYILIFDWENNPPHLSPYLTPDRLMFIFSLKELRLAFQLKQLMGENTEMHVDDLFHMVSISDMHPQTRQALISRIGSLRDSGFLSDNYITPREFCVPGKVTIFRLVGTPLGDLGIRFFVADIIRQVFEAKKKGELQQNVILVVDEAHLFAPAKGTNDPVREILIRVAREGRKMGVWLILATQSPRDLSDEIIINCSTIIALRMQKSDVARLTQLFGIQKSLAEVLTKTQPGECFIKAPSFTIPIMVRIRPRQSSEIKGEGVDAEALKEKIKKVALNTRELVSNLRMRHSAKLEKPRKEPKETPQPQEAISQTEVLAKKPEHIVAGTLPIPKAVKEVPSPTEGSLVQKQSMIQKVIEEHLDFAVESFASQIKALGKGILALVNALIENDKISIEHALNYVSEDLINSLVANKVIRIEDSYIKLNLDRKLEETLDRTPSITQVLVAKRKLKQLLESQ